MTEKQKRRLLQQYDDELESAGLMTGRKLKKLIAMNKELQQTIIDASTQEKVNTHDLRN